MATIEEINRRASLLSVEEIETLTDDEIKGLAMERPGHPGQYGFLLSPQAFRSTEHLAETLHALTKRLAKVGQSFRADRH
jgi:hypothetical protein